ncbi:uncharacterized protein LOC111061390 [Nilaparvata lugens]|uniref:uncharacterized protein LOC111061390 n=1 Tax=Nilaparvata lugens TaxID=108931 RepID=UPI00193CFAB2|nr:uncharacterized protein LOC111061390 [Nilaparvata lugens]
MYDESIDVSNAEEVRSPTPESLDSNFDKKHDDNNEALLSKDRAKVAMTRPLSAVSRGGERGGRRTTDLDSDLSHSEDDDDDDDDEDDDDVRVPIFEGTYDPREYEHLAVSADVKDVFKFITCYTPQNVELEYKLKPFVPDFIPAVGDIDAFIKVSRPDGVGGDDVGLRVLDEPCANQSEPAVLYLQLRAGTKQTSAKPVVVKKVEDAEKNPKAIDRWIRDISELHKSKPAPNVHYTKPMPDVDNLMQEWPADFEERLNQIGLPIGDLDCDLLTYIDIVCYFKKQRNYKINIQMSGELKEQRSNRFIPLNNLHPILKDLYSSSSHSSEFDITSGYLNNEPGTEEAIGFEEEELQQVDYVEGRHFPRYYNKRRRKNLNVTANKLVEEVIRLAVERLNTDAANSEVEEYFDAEESTGQDAPGNPQVNFNLRPSVEVVSISSQTDLIVDPNEDLEVIDADDNHSSSNEESSQQGGTGDTIRNEKYCRVTTQCERCEVYMLNCYKFQCKCENLTIYSETLEKKVEEYVNLLNNYNTRLMTSRLLIKQSNGKQNELMMRCDELQEKIRLHQALKEIEHRKKKEMKKKYYINKFNKDFYELKHKVSIGESELEVVKDIVDDDKMKDIFDKYKQIDGIDWERLSPEELAAALEDLEYLEITGIKSPKVESSALIGGKLSEPSESAIYEALNVYEDLLNGVLSRDEMNETFEKYKSLDSIDWSNLSPDRLRMTLKDLRDLELTERIRIFSGSESEQEIYSEDYQEVDEGIISKDESIGEKTRAYSFEQGRSEKLIAGGSKALGTEKTDSGVSMAIKERKLPSDYKNAIVEEKTKSDTELPKSTAETRDTDVLKKRGLVDEVKLSEIKSEEHGKDWELHAGAGKSDKLSAKSGRIPAEGIVMTDVSKDDGAVKDDEQRDREKLGEADLYTKREDVEKPPFDRTKKEIMKTEESKEPEKTTLKESERARGEELEELKMIKKLEEDDKHVPPIKTDVSKKVDDGSVGLVVPESKPTLEGFAEKDDLKISGRGLQSGKDTAEEIYKRTSDTDFKDSVRGKDENIVSPISERKEEQMRTKDGKSGMLDGDSRDGVTERRLEEIKSGKIEEKKDDLYPTSETTKDKAAVRKDDTVSEEDKKKVSPPVTEPITRKEARNLEEDKKKEITPATEQIMKKGARDYMDEKDGKLVPPIKTDKVDDRVTPDQYGREEDLATSKSKQAVGKDDQLPKRIDDKVTPDQYGREKDLATSKSKQALGKDDQLPKKIDDRIDDRVAPDQYGREEDLATSKSKQIVGKDDQIPKRIDDGTDDRVTPDQYGREEDLATSKSKQVVGKDDQLPKRIDDKVTPDPYGREEDLATPKSKQIVGKDDQIPKRIDDRIDDRVTPDQYGREEDLSTSKSKQIVGKDDQIPKRIDDRIDDRVTPDQYGREEDLATSKSKQVVGKDDQLPKRIDDKVTPDQYGREEDLATSKSKQVVGMDSDTHPSKVPRGVADTSGEKES